MRQNKKVEKRIKKLLDEVNLYGNKEGYSICCIIDKKLTDVIPINKPITYEKRFPIKEEDFEEDAFDDLDDDDFDNESCYWFIYCEEELIDIAHTENYGKAFSPALKEYNWKIIPTYEANKLLMLDKLQNG